MIHDHKVLSEPELRSALAELSDWQVVDGKLVREFKFKNFTEAFAFMTKVAQAAEKLNHHPEWTNIYNTVAFKLWTHETGGISRHDIQLAKLISQIRAG